MIHVVHVVVGGEIGGAERMLCALAAPRSNASEQHAVALLTPHRALARLFTDAGLRVHDRHRGREGPLRFLWSSLGPSDVEWIARVLRRERADVVHLHTVGSQVVGTRAARLVGANIVRTEHSTRAFEDPTCWPFARWSLARANACVAISRHVRQVALARAPWAAAKMHVVPNGVDIERFAPPPTQPPMPGGSLGPSKDFLFLLLGRLERRKGVDLALDALARVPGARLDILGDGKLRLPLEAHARRAGLAERVRFLGYAPDVRDAMARADAVLCSSRREGLGVALLETLAMERPVVAFAVGGVPEVVEDGISGWLAPEGDVLALAARMAEAMASRKELRRRGKEGRRQVIDRFSVEAMRDRYSAVYREVVSGTRARPGLPLPSMHAAVSTPVH